MSSGPDPSQFNHPRRKFRIPFEDFALIGALREHGVDHSNRDAAALEYGFSTHHAADAADHRLRLVQVQNASPQLLARFRNVDDQGDRRL